MMDVDMGADAQAAMWDQWTPETSPAERITAATLMDAGEGDVFEPDWPPMDVTVTVDAVHDARGHRRVYATIDEGGVQTRTRFVIVRGKYVFAFADDEDFLITADWSDDAHDALFKPSDRVERG